MGSVISRIFRKQKKEKSTYQKLEEIEIKIKELENYTTEYQLKQRRFIGNLLLYGIGSSVLAFVTFYFAFLPDTLEKKILYSIPILSLPIFIFLLKNLVSWYFQRYVNKNSEKLLELRSEKRELLDQVKNKETYKDAVEIFQRFGAATDRGALASPRTAVATQQAAAPSTPLDRRQMVSAATNMTPTTAFRTPAPRQLPSTITSNLNLMQQKLSDMQTPSRSAGPSFIATRSLKPTPYPVLDNTQKSVVDKMVDYLIGDGPSHRFAMICQQCFKHNGMALQEEYEYAAFRCAFCNFFNPAKKLRPMAPRLPEMAPSSMQAPSVNVQRPSSSTSESSSDSDNEISKMKSSNVQETSEPAAEPKHRLSDLDSESAVDDMEIIEKPERTDIEKKLE